MDMHVLVCGASGRFDIIPLLDVLEGRHTHLNGTTMMDQHAIEEKEGGTTLV